MLCMICNTNGNSVKCTTPNKHGFAYVIHYDNNGKAIHKHYRFINPDELPTIESQSEKNGSNEPNEPNEPNMNESQNGSNEPNESNISCRHYVSDNVSDNIVQYNTDGQLSSVPVTLLAVPKRKHKVLAKGQLSIADPPTNFNVPIAEDNML